MQDCWVQAEGEAGPTAGEFYTAFSTWCTMTRRAYLLVNTPKQQLIQRVNEIDGWEWLKSVKPHGKPRRYAGIIRRLPRGTRKGTRRLVLRLRQGLEPLGSRSEPLDLGPEPLGSCRKGAFWPCRLLPRYPLQEPFHFSVWDLLLESKRFKAVQYGSVRGKEKVE
jgi:hypothetical protein